MITDSLNSRSASSSLKWYATILDSPVLVKDTTGDDIPDPCDGLFVVGLLYLQPDGEDLAAHGSEVRALRHGEAGIGFSWHIDIWELARPTR